MAPPPRPVARPAARPAALPLPLPLLLLLLLAAAARAAPPFADYDSVRDLYELLLQREALEGRLPAQAQQAQQAQQALAQAHEVVRKANRSPSLRLRFGRRADPLFAGASFLEHSSVEGPVEN